METALGSETMTDRELLALFLQRLGVTVAEVSRGVVVRVPAAISEHLLSSVEVVEIGADLGVR
jgi:hypothetical protein